MHSICFHFKSLAPSVVINITIPVVSFTIPPPLLIAKHYFVTNKSSGTKRNASGTCIVSKMLKKL